MKPPKHDSRITPIDELFTYHIFGIPEECRRYEKDPGSYSLLVTELVDRETRLTLDQVRNEFPPTSAEMTLQCVTNVHSGRLDVTGARLVDVLDRAGIRDEACKVVLRSADGFDTDIRVEDVRGQPDSFLLAYEMNGEPLSVEHGFPLRMASDGRYGYKWPKWLTEIRLVDYDHRGHYEGKRGWSDEGIRGRPIT
jgi:DMSO/TMAO reductase YedYZ molybdopterin-dependent catalytic subunit